METSSPAPKQRSPWFYVLLGCGGLAGLMCIGGMVFLLGVGKFFKDVGEGVTDPEERRKNALKQLGALPEGYTVVASVNLFVMETTVMTDAPLLPDGGVELTRDRHTFSYYRVMANENNKRAREFLTGKETDPKALAQNGINIDPKDILKRGTITIDGRKVSYVASRGTLGEAGQAGPGLNTNVLFECPGEALHVGVWSQPDEHPDQPNEALELAGTVADEALLAPFLKPMNPCGR